MNSVGLLLIRVAIGVSLFIHGGQKLNFFSPIAEGEQSNLRGFADNLDNVAKETGRPYNVPNPLTAALIAAWIEVIGGALLTFGLLTRLAAIPTAFIMFVALTFHWRDLSEAPVFLAGQGGIELPMVFLLMALGLLFTGPGSLSLDAIFGFLFAGKKAEE